MITDNGLTNTRSVRDDIYKVAIGSSVLLPVSPGGSAGRFEIFFTDADLSISGVLVRDHLLSKVPAAVRVLDPTGDRVYPSKEADLTSTLIAIDLSIFRPLMAGQWKLILLS